MLRSGIHLGMPLDREYRFARGIFYLNLKRLLPIVRPLPHYDSSQNDIVLACWETWRIEFVEHTLKVELAIGAVSRFVTIEQRQLHSFLLFLAELDTAVLRSLARAPRCLVKRNNLNGVVYSASVCLLSPTALPHLYRREIR